MAKIQIAGIVLEKASCVSDFQSWGPGRGQGQRREQDRIHTSFMSGSKGNIGARPLGGPERYKQSSKKTGKVKWQKSQERSLVSLDMVLKKRVDLNRERPLQGGVGASMWKKQREEVSRSRKYRRILSMIVANIIKGWGF